MTTAAARPAHGPGHYLRDLVYGALDGVITTLAVIAGVSGASLAASVAIILGAANLLADGVSMGAANYLALRSELEQTGRSIQDERPLRHGAATFGAFVVAGSVPLLAYIVPLGDSAFLAATVLGAATLIAVGILRAPFVGKARWRSAAEMLAVGSLAASVAFAVGLAAERFVV